MPKIRPTKRKYSKCSVLILDRESIKHNDSPPSLHVRNKHNCGSEKARVKHKNQSFDTPPESMPSSLTNVIFGVLTNTNESVASARNWVYEVNTICWRSTVNGSTGWRCGEPAIDAWSWSFMF